MSVPALSSITIEGFKSIRERQTIAVRPLTILAGANSSGKTSFVQPLLLMKQTLENPTAPAGSLHINGANVQFSEVEQLLTRGGTGEFRVRLLMSPDHLPESIQHEYDDWSIEAAYCAREGDVIVTETLVRHGSASHPITIREGLASDELGALNERAMKQYASALGDSPRTLSAQPRRPFLELDLDFAAAVTTATFALGHTNEFHPPLTSLLHIGGQRGIPIDGRYYPRVSPGPHYPGKFHVYTASIMEHWQKDPSSEESKLVNGWLQHIGLTGIARVRRVTSALLEVLVGRRPGSGEDDLVALPEVGFGVSETLPVLVALAVAKPGQAVYIEQPELHLHPRAQRRLGEVLCEAAKRGPRLIVETHSALLLREVLTQVAKGGIPKDDVALHWMSRDDEGFTKVTTANLTDAGAHPSWPGDFTDVEMEAESDYIDASMEKLRAAAGS